MHHYSKLHILRENRPDCKKESTIPYPFYGFYFIKKPPKQAWTVFVCAVVSSVIVIVLLFFIVVVAFFTFLLCETLHVFNNNLPDVVNIATTYYE